MYAAKMRPKAQTEIKDRIKCCGNVICSRHLDRRTNSENNWWIQYIIKQYHTSKSAGILDIGTAVNR